MTKGVAFGPFWPPIEGLVPIAPKWTLPSSYVYPIDFLVYLLPKQLCVQDEIQSKSSCKLRAPSTTNQRESWWIAEYVSDRTCKKLLQSLFLKDVFPEFQSRLLEKNKSKNRQLVFRQHILPQFFTQLAVRSQNQQFRSLVQLAFQTQVLPQFLTRLVTRSQHQRWRSLVQRDFRRRVLPELEALFITKAKQPRRSDRTQRRKQLRAQNAVAKQLQIQKDQRFVKRCKIVFVVRRYMFARDWRLRDALMKKIKQMRENKTQYYIASPEGEDVLMHLRLIFCLLENISKIVISCIVYFRNKYNFPQLICQQTSKYLQAFYALIKPLEYENRYKQPLNFGIVSESCKILACEEMSKHLDMWLQNPLGPLRKYYGVRKVFEHIPNSIKQLQQVFERCPKHAEALWKTLISVSCNDGPLIKSTTLKEFLMKHEAFRCLWFLASPIVEKTMESWLLADNLKKRPNLFSVFAGIQQQYCKMQQQGISICEQPIYITFAKTS